MSDDAFSATPCPNDAMPSLDDVLKRVAAGTCDVDVAREAIGRVVASTRFVDAHRSLAADVDPTFPVRAIPDHDRETRTGFGEVIFGAGKTATDVVAIARALLDRQSSERRRLLVTRATPEQASAVDGAITDARYHAEARVISVGLESRPVRGRVVVLAAGTTDVPVAEEAALTARMWGADVERHYDVGIAGLHRLLERVETVRTANACVVVAGMEGALPSVVAGLVSTPMIAVPTSVGYGASFGGLAALLAMLNACAPGVVVVNIDNGFGAGFAAGQWNARMTASLDDRGDDSP